MKPPNKMYFQFYGEDLLPGQSIDDLEEPADMENITFCVDKIFDTDIEYIHKDAVVKLVNKYIKELTDRNDFFNELNNLEE